MPDNESPNGYVIGFEELYRAITRIESKMEDRFGKIAETQVTHGLRLDNLEKAQGRRWQVIALWLTVAASLVAAILPNLLH